MRRIPKVFVLMTFVLGCGGGGAGQGGGGPSRPTAAIQPRTHDCAAGPDLTPGRTDDDRANILLSRADGYSRANNQETVMLGISLVMVSSRLTTWSADARFKEGGEHFDLAQHYRCLADGAIDANMVDEERSYAAQMDAMEDELKAAESPSP